MSEIKNYTLRCPRYETKVSNILFFLVIKKQSFAFKFIHLFRQTERSLVICVFRHKPIKLEDLPRCAGLREAWEVILLAKLQIFSDLTTISHHFLQKSSYFLLICSLFILFELQMCCFL